MTAAVSSLSEVPVVPGRECGSWTLCCKVYNVVELGKSAGKWCSYCKPGRGCTIHDKLPNECAAFNCLWKTMPTMSMQWKPDQSKMVLTLHPETNNIQVVVDPGLPSAWTRQPYHGQLRSLSKNNMPKGHLVVVFVNELATLILPDEDVQLGVLTPEQIVSVTQEAGPDGGVYEVKIFNRRATADGQTLEVVSSSRHPVRSAA
ncbi:hypothetical protein IVA80_17315 [Bradyrhizobium sp. 139]|nr:hypothetical protein [Bradyrhizobium sp. 139]